MTQIRESCFNTNYSSLNRGKVAPYIDVKIGKVSWQNQQTSASKPLSIKALLDTGAASTLVPTSVLNKIGTTSTGLRPVKLRGIGKEVYSLRYPIEIYFCNYKHEIVVREWTRKWKSYETKHIIIGRDMLNEYGVLFDGFGLISDKLKYHVWNCVL